MIELNEKFAKIGFKPRVSYKKHQVYTIVNKAEHVEHEYEISEEDWVIIEARKKAFKAGKIKGITMAEMRKRFTKKFAS